MSVFRPGLGGLAVAGEQVSDLYTKFRKAVSPRVANGSPGIGPREPFNTQIGLKIIF